MFKKVIPDTIRVVIYIRVSTTEQAEHGYSLESQRERLLAYCKAKGWLVVDIYVDPGHSGASLDRPDIQRLLNDIGKYDMVLVYKLDRLSRSQKDTLHIIEDIFLPNGIDFVSMNENLDTSTPYGRAMVGILSAFAQLEREVIKDRTFEGREKRASKGFHHGGKFAPIGYDIKDGKLVINEYEAMQIRTIYDLYLAGNGSSRISKFMNEHYRHRYGDWSYPYRIQAILKNNVYIGTIKFAGKEYENSHEPIIERSKFEAVQKLLKANAEHYAPLGRNEALLSGFIFCSNCGARMYTRHQEGSPRAYYYCYSSTSTNLKMVKDPDCNFQPIFTRKLEAMVDYQIRQLVFDKAYLKKLVGKEKKPKTVSSNIELIKKRIAEINKETSNLVDLYNFESIPATVVAEKIAKIQEEKQGLEQQLQNISPESNSDPMDGLEALLENTAVLWDLADTTQKRALMSALIRSIRVYQDRAEIDWTFTSR